MSDDFNDVAVASVGGVLDIALFAGDVDTANALVTAVYASLFSDARAEEGDPLAPGEDPRGWWGDTYAGQAGDRFGCRWWTRRREVVTDELARWVGVTGTEALAWMVADNLAGSAKVTAYRGRSRPHALIVLAEIIRPSGDKLSIDVSKMWETLSHG